MHGPVTPTDLTQWRGRALDPFTVVRLIVIAAHGAPPHVTSTLGSTFWQFTSGQRLRFKRHQRRRK